MVEKGGLELLEWKLGESTVDSYFRLTDPLEFELAFERLLPKAAA